jgi:hypothetical protein
LLFQPPYSAAQKSWTLAYSQAPHWISFALSADCNKDQEQEPQINCDFLFHAYPHDPQQSDQKKAVT